VGFTVGFTDNQKTLVVEKYRFSASNIQTYWYSKNIGKKVCVFV